MVIGVPSYREIADLSIFVRNLWKQYNKKQRIEQLQRAQRSRENLHLYEFLKWKYDGYPILEWCQNIYPVIVFPAPNHQQYNVNSALSYPLIEEGLEPEAFADRDPTARVLLEGVGVPIENRLTYTMTQLNTNGALKLTCALGYYYYALDTCYSLEWEILSNLGKLGGHDKDDFKRFDEQLKLRKKLHAKVNDPIVDGSGRSAMIGISTLIAYNDNGKFRLWLRRRSKSDVAIHGGFAHVVPSFIFQPVIPSLQDEFNIPLNIFREYLEELFDRPEPEAGQEATYNYFYGDPRMQYLHMLLGRQEAVLLFTGVAIDLLSLRPEICTLLWIKTSEWFNRHSSSADTNRFKFNAEFRGRHDEQNGLDWFVEPVPFSHNDSELSRYKFLSASHITPAGAAFRVTATSDISILSIFLPSKWYLTA